MPVEKEVVDGGTFWRRRRTMAKRRDHSLSSEKRLEKEYPDDYPPMLEISEGVVACRAADDERFNQFLYETKRKFVELESL